MGRPHQAQAAAGDTGSGCGDAPRRIGHACGSQSTRNPGSTSATEIGCCAYIVAATVGLARKQSEERAALGTRQKRASL